MRDRMMFALRMILYIVFYYKNEIIGEYKQYWIYLKTELTKFHKNLFEILKLLHRKFVHFLFRNGQKRPNINSNLYKSKSSLLNKEFLC